MSVNWGTVAKTGLQVVGAVIPQVGVIEQLAKAVPQLTGQAKEDAVVSVATESLETAEGFAGKELLSDPQFQTAVRSFIQAYVGLQNVVNTKPAATQGPIA